MPHAGPSIGLVSPLQFRFPYNGIHYLNKREQGLQWLDLSVNRLFVRQM